MTATKKLIHGNGNQYFPQTHTKAVVDDNGYSVGERQQGAEKSQWELGGERQERCL